MELPGDLRSESIGALFARLIERGRDVIRAEITYYKDSATQRVTALVKPLVLGIVAVMIVQAALTVLLIAIGLVLWRWLGPVGGLFGAVVVGLLIAGGLVWAAVSLASAKPETVK